MEWFGPVLLPPFTSGLSASGSFMCTLMFAESDWINFDAFLGSQGILTQLLLSIPTSLCRVVSNSLLFFRLYLSLRFPVLDFLVFKTIYLQTFVQEWERSVPCDWGWKYTDEWDYISSAFRWLYLLYFYLLSQILRNYYYLHSLVTILYKSSVLPKCEISLCFTPVSNHL